MLYPELPANRTRMILLDLTIAVVAIGSWLLASTVHDVVAALAQPASSVQSAAADLAADLSRPLDLPLVGDVLQGPLGAMAAGSLRLESAAADQVDGVMRLALLAGALATVPGLLVVLAWLRHRLRWIAAAAAVRRARSSPDGTTILALRAAVRAPLAQVLAALDEAPTGRAEPAQARAAAMDPVPLDAADLAPLAALELARHGLRDGG